MLVLWSGGADSTVALYRQLIEPDNRVHALTIVVDGVSCADEQLWARNEQKRALAAMGYTFEHTTIEVKYSGSGANSRPWKAHGSIQGQWWLGNAVQFLRPDEDLCLSWIKGELDNLPATQAAFDGLQRVGEKTGKLVLPFRDWAKYHIVHNLKVAKLYDLTWSCELPLNRSANRSDPFLEECGACKKCLELETANWQLETYGWDALQKMTT